MQQTNTPAAPVLRLRDVEALTGRKRSSIYEDMAAGRMPRSIQLGPRAVGWLRVDIDAWLASKVAERDGCAAGGPSATRIAKRNEGARDSQ